MKASHLENIIITLLKLAATEFPQDVILFLIDVFRNKLDPITRNQLENFLENVTLAKPKIYQYTKIQARRFFMK